MKTYIAIDLKSFYASVECVQRNLDPLTTNLVVADSSRTEKTICLAVSPSLKAYGISGRARLFEVVQKVKEVNAVRLNDITDHKFSGKSIDSQQLKQDRTLEISFLIAPPQMSYYIKMSNQIYQIYLRYISPEDIHVYSIDEVFIDATSYLETYDLTAHELTVKLINEVLKETGITATAGIGTNLYLAKIAMDIVAKHIPADKNGVRISELDEMSYRQKLWSHIPITDFWRVGKGYASKLEKNCIYTMGDVARRSLYDDKIFYKLFGVNAELLIDHAWGWEPCTISDIKSYKPESHSLSQGQVLSCPYEYSKAKIIVREMTEILVLDLVEKGLVSDQIALTLVYDTENKPKGESTVDIYGRKMPKQAHGSENIEKYTSSSKLFDKAAVSLFERIADKDMTVRKIYVVLNHVIYEKNIPIANEQFDLFTDYREKEAENEQLNREKNLQKTIVSIKNRFGKNSILKGLNYKEGATTIQRNNTIGGHKA